VSDSDFLLTLLCAVHRVYGNSSEEYSTDIIRDRAVQSIRKYQNDSRPFFLYLAPYAVHTPIVPAPRHDGLLNGTKV